MFEQFTKVINTYNPVNYRAPLNRGLFAWCTTLPGMERSDKSAGTTTYNKSGIPYDICRSAAMTNTTATTLSTISRNGGYRSLYHQSGYGSYGPLTKSWIAPTGYAIAFWARPNNLAASQYITNFSATNTLAIILGFQANSWNIFEGSYAAGTSTITAINDTWQHVVYTRDASRVQGYLNGVLKIDTTHSWGNPGTITQININNAGGGAAPFYGWSDDFRLYRRSLLATDVAALYNASLKGYQREFNWIDRQSYMNNDYSIPPLPQYPIFSSFIT